MAGATLAAASAIALEAEDGPAALLRTQLQCGFNMFDKNGDGVISAKELGEYFASAGHDNLSEEDLAWAVDALERTAGIKHKDRTGALDWDAFGAFIHSNHFFEQDKAAMEHAFSVFDVEGKGTVTAQDVLDTLHKLGDDAAPADIIEVFKSIKGEEMHWETEKDTQSIDRAEFKRLLFEELKQELAADEIAERYAD